MQVYIARQPILDGQLKVVAYELLYRSSSHNSSSIVDGDRATLAVLGISSMEMELDDLTNGKKAFVNFTQGLILEDYPTMFTSQQIVVELLEDVISDVLVLDSCQRLRQLGYTLALDDFTLAGATADMVAVADIIKVDFRACGSDERAEIIRRYRRPGLVFLAEKVETMEEFHEAREQGFELFQGYFFARPEVLNSQTVKTQQSNYFALLAELNKSDPECHSLTRLIESDVSMAYKLLRLVNSIAFSGRVPVSSIREAVVRLGHRELRRWTALLMVQELCVSKPDVLMRQSLVRARFAECLGNIAGLHGKHNELFLLGLLSLLDALVDQPMHKALEGLPINPDIKDCLLGKTNEMSPILSMLESYERGLWDKVSSACVSLGLNESSLSDCYLQAIQWANALH